MKKNEENRKRVRKKEEMKESEKNERKSIELDLKMGQMFKLKETGGKR